MSNGPLGGIGHDFNGNGVLFSFDPTTSVVSTLHRFSNSPRRWRVFQMDPSPGLTEHHIFRISTEGSQVANNGTIFTFNLAPSATYHLALLHWQLVGVQPDGSLTQSASNLVGMTTGAIFSFDLGTSTVSTLHNFAGAPTDGKFPQGSLIQSGSTLYGMAQLGGSANLGALFAFDLSTNKQTLLHSFTGGTTDGSGPKATLRKKGA